MPEIRDPWHREAISGAVDAEKDPVPDMLIPLSWDAVKSFFLGEAPRLL
jgi:hypothetical protein